MNELTFLTDLEAVIRSRINDPMDASYTARLVAEGPLKVAQKLGEEAVETALASVAQDDTRVCSEAADLVYHLLVLLALRGLNLGNVVDELERRHREKSSAPRSVPPSR